MKKIFKNVLYDSDTANPILETETSSYDTETLYRKRNGKFFILAVNSYDDGCTVIPLSDEKAKDFVAENGSVDLYVELFGEVTE